MTYEEMQALKRRHSAQLLGMPGVCGVGIELDEAGKPVLTVHLDSDDPSAKANLPAELEGHPVKFVASGPFHKQ